MEVSREQSSTLLDWVCERTRSVRHECDLEADEKHVQRKPTRPSPWLQTGWNWTRQMRESVSILNS